MATHPHVRVFLAAVLALAAAGCTRHSATQATSSGDDSLAPRDARAGNQGGASPFAPRRATVVPAGTRLEVRLAATLSSASAAVGERVHGELAAPLAADGGVVAEAGTPVEVTVTAAVPSGRLAHTAQLALAVTGMRVDGDWLPVVTSAAARAGSSHGKRNTRFIGGGAVLGALVGQLVGGNHNATLRGAAVGAAAGTGAAAATGKADVTIAAGEVVTFVLAQPVDVPR